jgi:KDO2-lipid IV(A) lauroyltransferase
MSILSVLLYPFSLLPLKVLYIISDCANGILFGLFKYRKSVIHENLSLAFPEKDAREIEIIAKQFQRSFCDQWIETLKLLSMSEKRLNSRITANWEVFDELAGKNKDCYALVGHMFNWEWLNVAWQYNIKQQYACFYAPVSNRGFDKLMYRIRSKSGAWLLSMKAKKGMQRLQGVRFVLGLAADQNPVDIKNAIWLPFMNRVTPFFRGAEKMARRSGAAVVMTTCSKTSRGRYNIVFEIITEDASLGNNGELTEKYVRSLEKQLHTQPENWLWSHRRWKYSLTEQHIA